MVLHTGLGHLLHPGNLATWQPGNWQPELTQSTLPLPGTDSPFSTEVFFIFAGAKLNKKHKPAPSQLTQVPGPDYVSRWRLSAVGGVLETSNVWTTPGSRRGRRRPGQAKKVTVLAAHSVALSGTAPSRTVGVEPCHTTTSKIHVHANPTGSVSSNVDDKTGAFFLFLPGPSPASSPAGNRDRTCVDKKKNTPTR